MKYIKLYCFLAVILFQMGCNKKENEEKTKPGEEETYKRITISSSSLKDIEIKIETAETKSIESIIKAPARLIPNQDFEAQVGSLLQGRVSEVFVKLGDYVKKGQNLMHIVGLEVGEIKSQFLKAKASLIFSEGNLERQKTLSEQNIGSQKSLLEAQSEYDKAIAEFNAVDKKIHSIGLDDNDVTEFIEYNSNKKSSHTGGILPIKAPIDGIVVERNIVIGQLVDATTNCFKIINTSSLWVDAQINEKDISLIDKKNEVIVKTSAFPNENFMGKIIYIGEVVDDKTRTLKVRALIPNTNRKLKPEMFADMFIPTNNRIEGVLIPNEAVLKDGNNEIVFIVINDTTFEKTTVITGRTEGEFTHVLKGIKAGDKIVSKGSFLLKSELKKETFGESE